MTSPHPALSVRDLRFRYPGAAEAALRSAAFDVWPGEVLGVLGANGSGKSTLLTALLGARKGEVSGRVVLAGGADVPRTRTIGYATQQTALYRHLTVGENLLHMARLVLPGRRVRSAVRDCVEEYELAPVLRRPVGELSGGWQRLTHVAASFLHDPPVRLLDEPTAALDFQTRGRIVRLVKDWATSRHTAIVVTSHYPEDLEEMCDRLIVLRAGAVVRSATLTELLSGLRREIVVEATDGGVSRSGRAPLPRDVGDLADHVSTAVLAGGMRPEARIDALRLTSATLRGLLADDPELGKVSEA